LNQSLLDNRKVCLIIVKVNETFRSRTNKFFNTFDFEKFWDNEAIFDGTYAVGRKARNLTDEEYRLVAPPGVCLAMEEEIISLYSVPLHMQREKLHCKLALPLPCNLVLDSEGFCLPHIFHSQKEGGQDEIAFNKSLLDITLRYPGKSKTTSP
jgi:hypothetical protein